MTIAALDGNGKLALSLSEASPTGLENNTMNTRRILIPAAVLVSLLTFVYLYIGLWHFAAARTDPVSAALYPFAIDAVVLVFLIAALDAHVKGKHYAFVWSIVASGSAVSAITQYVVHDGAWWERMLLAFPALALVSLTHLLWVIAQDSLHVREQMAHQQEAKRILEVVPDAPPNDLNAEAVRVLEAAQARGIKVTGNYMAERLGLFEEDGVTPAYQKGYHRLKQAMKALKERDEHDQAELAALFPAAAA